MVGLYFFPRQLPYSDRCSSFSLRAEARFAVAQQLARDRKQEQEADRAVGPCSLHQREQCRPAGTGFETRLRLLLSPAWAGLSHLLLVGVF